MFKKMVENAQNAPLPTQKRMGKEMESEDTNAKSVCTSFNQTERGRDETENFGRIMSGRNKT